MANSKAVFPVRFYALLFVTGIASFLVHELAHWTTGIALGHEMVATLNSVSPKGAVGLKDQVLSRLPARSLPLPKASEGSG